MSPIFGGTDEPHNILYVPVGVSRIKEGYDDILADLVEQGKAKSFNCTPEYKGKSVVPCKITITSGKDGVEVHLVFLIRMRADFLWNRKSK